MSNVFSATRNTMFQAIHDRDGRQASHDTGRSKGFGFVEFASAEEGKKAIEGLHGKELQGRTINVAEARPREDRGGGRGGPRDRY